MPESLGGPGNPNFVLILDSWPVMEWLKRRQPVAPLFRSIIESAQAGKRNLLISSINLGEIYYNCWNEWNEARAEQTLGLLGTLPIVVIHPTEEDVLTAARIKGRYKCSYADAFAAVLAVEFSAPVLTGDPDFHKLRAGGLIDVEWMGA